MSDTKTISETKVEYFTKADIYKVREQGGKGLPIGKVYDPERFWNDLGEDYYKAFTSQQQLQANTPWIIDRIKMLGVATMLDIGCGFGRILPFLLEAGVVKSCVGVDISDSILKCAEDYLNPTPSDNMKLDDYRNKLKETKMDDMLKIKLEELLIQQYAKRKQSPPDFRDKSTLKKADARELSFESDSFDCVLSNETLQHLCPEDAEDVLLHMVRASKNSIVLVERWAYPGEHSQPDLWSHNYVEILNKLGVNVAQSSVVSNGIQGIVALKR